MQLVHAKILGPHMPNPIYCTSSSVSVSQHPGAGPRPSGCRQPRPLSRHPSPAAPAPAATPGTCTPQNQQVEYFQALLQTLHPPYTAFGCLARLPKSSPQPHKVGVCPSSPEPPTAPRGSQQLSSLLSQNSGFESQGRPVASLTFKPKAVGPGAQAPRWRADTFRLFCPARARAQLPEAEPVPNSPELPRHFRD